MNLIPRLNTATLTTSLFSATLVTAVLAVPARGDHAGDIALTISNGHITTHAMIEAVATPHRVFAGVLGEFGLPGVGDEPGFDSEAGTFEPSSLISFVIGAPLLVWDGEGFVTTASQPLDGVRMRMSFDALSTTTSDRAVDGFALAVAPNGAWHIHYIFELLPAEGETEVAPGAYLLELTLSSSQQGVAESQPFWIVFNHELADQEFDMIVEYAEESLVCTADLNGDCLVDGADLAIVLGNWGSRKSLADLNGDDIVDGADLAIVLGNWS